MFRRLPLLFNCTYSLRRDKVPHRMVPLHVCGDIHSNGREVALFFLLVIVAVAVMDMDTLNTLVQSVTVCDCRSRGFGFASWIGIQRVAGFLRWPIQRFRVSILDRHSKSCWVSLTINRRCITRPAWIGLDSALSRQSRLSLCKSVKKNV